jgi:hypothetical protein
VTAAYESKWCGQLDRLVADVTPAPYPAPVGPPRFVRQSARTNTLAIASLVCAFVWFAWIGSLLAIVCGHLALGQIRASGGRETGRGLAVAGLALGYIELLSLAAALVASR